MVQPHQVPQRQLDLGPAGWFRPEALDPPANQIRVKAGYVFAGKLGVRVPNPALSGFPQDQLTAGFAVVAPGLQRYDLVYLQSSGIVAQVQGTPVPIGTPFPQGAPGWEGTNPGPAIPDDAVPVAWVLVNETASVTITPGDIAQIDGFLRVSRDLDGYLIDKGTVVGPFVGTSHNVSALFAGETPGGGTLVRGVITAPPLNLVHLLDQKGDELVVGSGGPGAALGAQVHGRLTEAAGVWTLAFVALDNSGAEVAIAPATDLTAVPSSIRLAGTPKVFARGESGRPLFASAHATISDQAAGDIPYATETTDGKVRLAAANDTAASEAVQGNDPRLAQGTTIQLGTVFAARVTGDKAGAVSRVQGASGGSGMDFFGIHTLNFIAASAGQVTNPSPGVVDISATGSPGPPGPAGPAGPTGPTGPTGPGFSSHGPYAIGPMIFSFPSTSSSQAFGFGFTVRFYMVCLTHLQLPLGGQADTIAITNVTVAGSTVTVFFSATDSGGLGADIQAKIGCSAAG